MTKVFTVEEVAQHNTEKDCWLIIGNESTGGRKVYDCTKFLDDHPGGPEVISELAGGDGDDEFEDIGHSRDAREQLEEFYIGDLKEDASTKKKKAAVATPADGDSGSFNPFLVLLPLVAIAVGIYLKFSK